MKIKEKENNMDFVSLPKGYCFVDTSTKRYRLSSLTKFTLIEMLVVIAIIGILASMLMPALISAQESAKSIVCAGNLKTLGSAAQMYSDDYNYYWVPFKFDAGAPWNRNLKFIENYTGATQTPRTNYPTWTKYNENVPKGLLCPSVEVVTLNANNCMANLGGAYGMNLQGFTDAGENVWDGGTHAYRLVRITAPSKKYSNMDANQYALDANCSNPTLSSGVMYRHPRYIGANTVFFDGHIENLSAADMYLYPRPNKNIDGWNVYNAQ